MGSDKSSRFPGEFDSLPAISDFASGAAEAAGLSEDAVYEVQLAVDEACANIIEHAYVLCRSGLIEVRHLPPRLREKESRGSWVGRTRITLKELEAIHISDAIRRHGGNRTAAAKELGINPSTLFRKIKSLGLEVPEQDGRHRKRE